MGRAEDPAVHAYAQGQQMTIITGDKGLSNVRAYPPPHGGIVVVEVPDTMLPDMRRRIILYQLATPAGQSLENSLVVVEPGRVRIRQ